MTTKQALLNAIEQQTEQQLIEMLQYVQHPHSSPAAVRRRRCLKFLALLHRKQANTSPLKPGKDVWEAKPPYY